MKKKIFIGVSLGLVILNLLVFSLSVNANERSTLSSADENDSCSWKEVSERGWWGKDYEACLKSGDGNSCTCGETTR